MINFLNRLKIGKKPNYTKFSGRRRDQLSQQIDHLFNSKIAYGPFAGLQLPVNSKWSTSDRGSIILGLYEKEVLDYLESTKAIDLFINIGAADGYYAAGVVFSGIAQRAIAYEIDLEAHETIREISVLNGIEKKIEIRGGFDGKALETLSSDLIENTLVLIDIEGAEFELLDDHALELLSRYPIIIETHEFVEHGEEKLSLLLDRIKRSHSVSRIFTGSRDLSGIKELRSMSDNDRWLLCSEGRPCLMSWLFLNPK